MTGPHTRAYAAGHRRAHLIPEGSAEALCGARPREDSTWHAGGGRAATVPDCHTCTGRARIADAIATWDGPQPRPGILAMVAYCGKLLPAGECARCGKLRVLPCRGLCNWCEKKCRADGTITDWGWTRAERIAEYARWRAAGRTLAEAAALTGVQGRTATRYEKALADAGQAPWRQAS